jgi:hypothetical protein
MPLQHPLTCNVCAHPPRSHSRGVRVGIASNEASDAA